jgi:anti-anti-sigma factor
MHLTSAETIGGGVVVSCDIERDGIHICIGGEMTIYDAAAVKDGLLTALQAHTAACFLDLSKVSAMDSRGLQQLLIARRSAAARHAAFGILSPCAAMRELLSLLHWGQFIREL